MVFHALFVLGVFVGSAAATEPPPLPTPAEHARACYIARITEAARALLPDLSEGPMRLQEVPTTGPLVALSARLMQRGIRGRSVQVEMGSDSEGAFYQGVQVREVPPGAPEGANLRTLLEKLSRMNIPLVLSPDMPTGRFRILISRAFDPSSAAVVVLSPDLSLARGDVGGILANLTDLVGAPEAFVDSVSYLNERTVRRAAGLRKDRKVSERRKGNIQGAMRTQLEINLQTEAGNWSDRSFVDPKFWKERPLPAALKREALRSLDSMNALNDVRWKNAKFRFFTRKTDTGTYTALIAQGIVWGFNTWVVLRFLLPHEKKRKPAPAEGSARPLSEYSLGAGPTASGR